MRPSCIRLFTILLVLSHALTAKSQIITTIVHDGFTEGMWHIAADSAGTDIYFTDNLYSVIRKVTPYGTSAIVLGTGVAGYSGYGPAISTLINKPAGIAADGNVVYFADAYNNMLRKSDTGYVFQVCGSVAGFGGDGGPATGATINKPFGLKIDRHHNIYFADVNNHRVRRIDGASGVITTVAGTGVAGFSGDGGPATLAQLTSPYDVAIDTAGNIYVADQGNHRVRKITPTGTITTFAGNGTPGFSGDGGPATAAQFNLAWAVTADLQGAIYVTDQNNNRIRRIGTDTAHTITTYVGTGTAGFSGDGGAATAARLNHPTGTTIDRAGNMYICDMGNSAIRKITTANYAPRFTDTAIRRIKICSGPTPLDTLLAVADTNSGQLLSWSIVSGPSHGTASVSYAAPAPGTTSIIPSGTSYTPFAGYQGRDTIKLRVTDGMADDTTMVTFHVGPPDPSYISCDCYFLNFIPVGSPYPVRLYVSDTTGTWSCSNAHAGFVSPRLLLGYTEGLDTIYYTLSDECGSTTSSAIFIIGTYIEAVNTVQAEHQLDIYPNPTNGLFTLLCGDAANKIAHVSITNIVGREVKSFDCSTNVATDIVLDEPDGMYFIRAVTDNEIRSGKIVLQKK